jgi:hypothetical protein
VIYLDELKRESQDGYTEFSNNELSFESRLFGRQSGSVAHILECRCVSGQYRVALVKFREHRCAHNVGNFQMLDEEHETLADAKLSIKQFLDSWHGAEDEHRHAGVDHYKAEIRNAI